ncbi:heavy metal-associated isoprenylated plant protein 33-like [Primulina eburnea]|uniref:heavy metal-associated isoprenylated plant protein 33-like n=1 Tax=Primulina eburnea TaxID=1245227 RepID=UPI003C6CC02E
MSKEEFLKIQTCVLKVNIHCDGCKHKVKKILQKIDGVYTTNIDSEQGKVTVSGNVDPATLIKKLTKNGKHAEIWGASKTNNNNQNQLNNQFKNLQIDNGSKGGQNKGQTPKGGGNNQPKVGLQPQNPQFQQQLQHLQQQMQQFKGSQDLKIPPQFMKDLKGANNNKDQNQKSAKFNMPEDEEYSDDDFDDDDYDDDDDFDDEVDDIPVVNNKIKPPVLGDGHGGAQMGNIMMNNIMNGQHPHLVKGGGNDGGNGKKGGGGGGGGSNVPVQMNLGGGNQNQGGGANGGKKGGNGNNNGGNQNQGGGKGGKNGGGQPNDGKNGGGGGNGQNKNGGGAGAGAGALNANNSMGNGARKEGGMNDGPRGMPNMMPMSAGGNIGPLGANLPMGQMGNLPMGQMNNLAAVQGLPAPAITGGGGGGAGYFPAATPEHMTANPYYQQQLAAMMMNQQRANGNERFQPMMYARPPPAVNYMPPYPAYPYQYPYAPPQGERTDQYAMFSDENTSSCNVM